MRPEEVSKSTTANQRVLSALLGQLENLRPGGRLPSIRDLLGEYGVNQTTLERCLGFLEGQGRIVRRSRSGIYMAEHGQEHRRSEVKTVSLVMPSVRSRPDMACFLDAFSVAATDAGWLVQTLAMDGRHEQFTAFIRRCREVGVWALVVFLDSFDIFNDQYCQALRSIATDHRLPLIFVGLAVPGFACDLVHSDDVGAYRQATMELLRRGRRRLLFVGSEAGSLTAKRMAGVRQAMNAAEADVRLDHATVPLRCYVLPNPDAKMTADRIVAHFPERTDAMIVGATPLLPGAFLAVERLGRTIGGDLELVSSIHSDAHLPNDSMLAMRKPDAELGRKTFEIMVRRIAQPHRPALDCHVPFELEFQTEVE